MDRVRFWRSDEGTLILCTVPVFVIVVALWIASVVVFSTSGSIHDSLGSVTGSACGSMNALLFGYMIILSAIFAMWCCVCVAGFFEYVCRVVLCLFVCCVCCVSRVLIWIGWLC